MQLTSTTEENQNPPLPIDLDVPYNDDFRIFRDEKTKQTSSTEKYDKNRKVQQSSVLTWRNAASSTSSTSSTTKSSRNRNFIVNNYTPTDVRNPYNNNNNNNNNDNSAVRKTYTKHKNIIVSTSSNNNNNNRSMLYERNDDFHENGVHFDPNYNNNFFNTNWTTMFVGGGNSNDRPSHKTHVEIITKNGATKKPNIIVNNYNPEIMMAPNPNPNFNSMLMTNLLSGRGQDQNSTTGSSLRNLYDRKITCMLYLQADHTFFQKMGSDEASIEAITRHVQRANSIYKNTGEPFQNQL